MPHNKLLTSFLLTVLSVSVDGREAGISIRDEHNIMLLGVLAACKISDAQPTSRPTPARRPVAEMDIMVMEEEFGREQLQLWRVLRVLTIPLTNYSYELLRGEST